MSAVKLLWEAAKYLPKNSTCYCKVRSEFLTTCYKRKFDEEVHLPASFFGDNNMCKFCCNMWIYGKYTYRVIPQKHSGKQMLKLLRKNMKSPHQLTKCEKSLLLLTDRNFANKLVLHCSMCNKNTIIPLKKSEKKSKEIVLSEIPIKISQKKKKKKKDVFAGLNPIILTTRNQDLSETVHSSVKLNNRDISFGRSSVQTGTTSNQNSLQTNITARQYQNTNKRHEQNKTNNKNKSASGLAIRDQRIIPNSKIAFDTVSKVKKSTLNKKVLNKLLKTTHKESKKSSLLDSFLSLL